MQKTKIKSEKELRKIVEKAKKESTNGSVTRIPVIRGITISDMEVNIDLNGLAIINSCFEKVSISSLENTLLLSCSLHNIFLKETSLVGSLFLNCNIDNIVIENLNAYTSMWWGTKIKKARVSFSDFSFSSCVELEVTDSSLWKTSLKGTQMTSCVVSEIVISCCDLRDTIIEDLKINGPICIHNSKIEGINLVKRGGIFKNDNYIWDIILSKAKENKGIYLSYPLSEKEKLTPSLSGS